MTTDSVPKPAAFQLDPTQLQRDYGSPRIVFGLIMTGVSILFMVLALIPLGLVLYYVTIEGGSKLSWDLFVALPPPPLVEGGGFGNALVGTIIMVAIGAAISVPVGVMAAIYLAEFGTGKIADWVRFANKVLSGVPSIIVGVFAYAVLVVTFRTYSAWAGGFAMAILMLPTIIASTDEALKLVPQEVRQASVGIGANDYQTVLRVVLPAAVPAIVTGVTLAVARAAGETAPLIFTALFTQFWPNWSNWLLEPTASLSVMVYNFAIVPFENQQEMAFAGSFVLVFFVLLTSVAARLATARRVY
ncbi:MAG: phosphate ABC transporter permease PstA [Spirulinaceae cyanobacterium SM2_1_0]|nr:phosphate ABC transporter permease PstA [Spirulinaceae cyanobacterium SM2_1_0]